MVRCPKCNSEQFYYVQDCTEYHSIDAIYDEGNVDLSSLVESYPHDGYRLQCEACDWSGSTKDYHDCVCAGGSLMANNYMRFSEAIGNITAREATWIHNYLSKFEDIEVPEAEFYKWCEVRGLDPQDDYVIESWPNFEYEIEKSGDPWLHCDEGFDIENVVNFVQAFLREFRPTEIFKMTYASYCDKPRVGEFSGGWAAVTAYDAEYGNAYSAVEVAAKRLSARVELETQSRMSEMKES